MAASTHAYDAAERVARESYGKLLAHVAARSGDLANAEDALADAFAVALERWPRDGVPATPEAWLLVAARRRVLDGRRREQRFERVRDTLGAPLATADALDEHAGEDAAAELVDERLAMMFACAHPAIAEHVRGPLLLQAVLGFDAARIASVFLVAPATMSQRLVRAKRKIAATNIPLRVPPPDERAARLDVVLSAIYATFVQGWDDPGRRDPRARGFVDEALYLGRLVARLSPDEPEALGLVALMLHADARAAARRAADGAYVPLDAQDPALWNASAIAEAEALLARAARIGRIGRFQIEAAIQSVHAARRVTGRRDDVALLALYDMLVALTQSPVVAINRAVTLARVAGAAAGLAALDAVADTVVRDYQPYWAARADLLQQLGDAAGARAAYQRAMGLSIDPAVRRFLAERIAALG
jgi:RNA polymerase sigma-70 factor (ECF subfamily)